MKHRLHMAWNEALIPRHTQPVLIMRAWQRFKFLGSKQFAVTGRWMEKTIAGTGISSAREARQAQKNLNVPIF